MNTHADEKICDNCNKKFKVVMIYHKMQNNIQKSQEA